MKQKDLKQLFSLLGKMAEKLKRFQIKGYLSGHDKTLAEYEQMKTKFL